MVVNEPGGPGRGKAVREEETTMKTATLLAALVAIAIGCEEKADAPAGVKVTKISETLEYRLAIFNAKGMVPEDHPTIPQFKTVLSSLDAKYPEDAKRVAELSVEAQQSLEMAAIREPLLSLMQNVDKAGGTHANYAAAVNAYVTRRKSAGR
jgi:hypothetical protein